MSMEYPTVPFVVCGGENAFDSDRNYPLNLTSTNEYRHIAPVQPPIHPPYEAAKKMRNEKTLAKVEAQPSTESGIRWHFGVGGISFSFRKSFSAKSVSFQPVIISLSRKKSWHSLQIWLSWLIDLLVALIDWLICFLHWLIDWIAFCIDWLIGLLRRLIVWLL